MGQGNISLLRDYLEFMGVLLELEEGGAGGTESMSPTEDFGDASYCCGDSSGKEVSGKEVSNAKSV